MKRKALLSIGVFSSISEKSLESLEHIMSLRYIEKNAILHYEGDLVDSVCLLARGKVELYKMDKNNNELFLCYVDSKSHGNRLINASGAFVPYEASANVRGVEPSEIVLLPLVEFHHLVQNDIQIANAFLYELMDKIIVFKTFVNFKETYDSTSRVAYLLSSRLTYFNQTQRRIIAHELNIKLETLSRILQKMMMQGLIDKDEKGDIYIKDKQTFGLLYGDMSQSNNVPKD